jgi:gamma-glutamyltranspeptidase / glutathione hydrolase
MKKAISILGLILPLAGCSAEEKLNPASVEGAGTPADSGAPSVDIFKELPKIAPTATGKGGAAATVDIRGTLAAIEVLKRGGNAIDAAVAAAGVLGVTDPFSCGIGGGGFMVIYLADAKSVVTIDHRETAPAGLSARNFYENGAVVPFADLVTSGLSVGVPGTVRGWSEALRRYGTKGFADLLPLAVQVAEGGFEVDQTFTDQIGRNAARFAAITATKKLYLNAEGKPWPVGTIFKNPELGKTYRLLAEGGEKAFYEGKVAEAIVAAAKSPGVEPAATIKVRPGVIALADLAGYEARVRPPVSTTYRGYTVYGMGLPSSGGLTVFEALNLLEGFDTKSLSSVDILHRFIGASRLAFADRNTYDGDPEFVSVPVAGLLSKAYATSRAPLIDLVKAPTAAATAGDPTAFQNDPSHFKAARGKPNPDDRDAKDAYDNETTNIVVSDAAGNLVAYTCTIESEGGNAMVVPGYGFLLNNELTDFNMPADVTSPHPNVAEPGKRPRSSISPTIVINKDGKPELVLGAPGGSTIITTVLQILVGYVDQGLPIDKALAAPRVSQRNSGDGSSNAETAFLATPEAMGLMMLGHKLSDTGTIGGEIGAATAIRVNPDGTLTAVAEPKRRGSGSAMVGSTP